MKNRLDQSHLTMLMGSSMELAGNLLRLGVVIVLSFFASIMPACNAACLTINEVLDYE